MNELKLVFPELSFGREQGLNHAGINSFSDDYCKRIVREGIQNALDAATGEKVDVGFSLHEIPRENVPAIDEIERMFQSALDFWKGRDAETLDFSGTAKRVAEKESIYVLEMADYGTRGLQKDKGWWGLVLAGGVSMQETDAAGGSYGIGKYATFGGSLLRTVFYSTKTIDGWTAFQGACEFATHLNANGRKTQQTGYIGIPGEDEVLPLEDFSRLPNVFKRSKTGTSVFVAGYRNTSAQWENELIVPVIEHFWPAIHDEKLTVTVGTTTIRRENLSQFIEKFRATEDDFTCYHYYSSIAGRKFEKALKGLGKCHLFLLSGGKELPKKVCMTRKTGMVIENRGYFRSNVPFSGWFTCISDHGNAELRKLETPRHDEWAPKNKGHDGTKILKEIKTWINECLAELNPDDDDEVLDIPELARYLPDDEDLDDSDFQREGEAGENHDSFEFKPTTAPLEINSILKSKSRLGKSKLDTSPADGGEGGEGEGGGKAEPDGPPNDGEDGKPKESGGGDTGENRLRKVSTRVKSRAIKTAESCYRLIISAENKPVSGEIEIRAVGDDNKASALTVKSAKNASNRENVDLKHVSIEAGATLTLNVVVAESQTFALEVVCHDN